jgi:hypothetical protein
MDNLIQIVSPFQIWPDVVANEDSSTSPNLSSPKQEMSSSASNVLSKIGNVPCLRMSSRVCRVFVTIVVVGPSSNLRPKSQITNHSMRSRRPPRIHQLRLAYVGTVGFPSNVLSFTAEKSNGLDEKKRGLVDVIYASSFRHHPALL